MILTIALAGFYSLTVRNSALKNQVRVALIGDSITEITPYPNYASKILGEKYIVRNFGVCGSQVSLDSDNPYMYSGAFNSAVEFQPNIVIIMLGTNDALFSLDQYLGNFIEDYLILIEKFQALQNKPAIWLVKPPPIYDAFGASVQVFDKEIIPAIEQIANQTSLPLIDVYAALGNPDYFQDGVHPNDKGASVIADVVCKAITLKYRQKPRVDIL
jgi:hypothetical protein